MAVEAGAGGRGGGSRKEEAAARGFTKALTELAREKRWEEVVGIFEEMARRHVAPNALHLSAAVNVCAKSGRPEAAEAWFRHLHLSGVRPETGAFNGVIAAFARVGRAADAERWLSEMLACHVQADTVSYSTVLCARVHEGDARGAEAWLEEMIRLQVEANEVTYTALIDLNARRGEVEQAERWLDQMRGASIRPDAVACNALINACARVADGERAAAWLQWMLEARLPADAVSYSCVAAACAESEDLSAAEAWLERMRADSVAADAAACNAAIHLCARRGEAERAEAWLRRMGEFQAEPDVLSYSAVVDACAQAGDPEAAERWLGAMAAASVRANAVAYNAVINAHARTGDSVGAQRQLDAMLAAQLSPDLATYNTVAKAYAQAGEVDKAEQWHERALEARAALPHEGSNPSRVAAGRKRGDALHRGGALYRLTSVGDRALAQCMERALELQWVYGYPQAPPGEPQLTHGTFKYIAGMQAATGREMLSLDPSAKSVLDVFCGSGTVLVEALASGRQRVVGSDASPLAVFVAAHHCDAAGVDVAGFLQLAEEVAGAPLQPEDDEGSRWELLRRRIAQEPPSAARGALRFALAVALQRAADAGEKAKPLSAKWQLAEPPDGRAPQLLLAAARRYAGRLAALRAAAPPAGRKVELHHCDCRQLRLSEPVDAVVTGPPYPGVYDYLGVARHAGQQLRGEGTDDFDFELWQVCGGSDGPPKEAASAEPAAAAGARQELEIGAREQWRSQPLEDFLRVFQAQQEEWLTAAYMNVRPGGSATLMIGDGDTLEEENGIDCLASTLSAAEVAGFHIVAHSSIASTLSAPRRVRGRRRTEHIVHLRRG